MKFKKINIITILVFLLVFGGGLILGLILRDIDYFTFKSEVSIGDISSLALTLFLALFIPFYLDRKLNNRRVEKDLVIAFLDNLIQEVKLQISYIEDLHISNEVLDEKQKKKVNLNLKKLSNYLDTLIDSCENYKKDKEISQLIEQLKNLNYTFWRDLTFNIGNTDYKIDTELFQKIEPTVNSFELKLNKLKLTINNY